MALITAAKNGEAPTVLDLLLKGAKINATDANNNSALHWACLNSHFHVVKLLVGFEADLSARGKFGFTPLHFATQGAKSLELIHYLTCHGGNPHAKSNKGLTCMDSALLGNNAVGIRFCMEAKIDVNTRRWSGVPTMDLVQKSGWTLMHVGTLCRNLMEVDLGNDLDDVEEEKQETSDFEKMEEALQKISDGDKGGDVDTRRLLQEFEALRRRFDDQLRCGICAERPKSVVFSCGHLSCHACSGKIDECHICRKPIAQRKKCYIDA